MPLYAIHKQEPKFIFIVNYKVMYSSLNSILPFYFPEVEFLGKKAASKVKFKDFPIFSIVRNPYDRVVSTFYGKCRKSPNKYLNQESAQLQYSQCHILEALKKVRKEAFEIAEPAVFLTHKENPAARSLLDHSFNTLLSISFEEYLQCIELIFKSKRIDGHFQVQYKAFDIPRQNPFYFPAKVFKDAQIIKLENIKTDWAQICDQLGTELVLVKKNSTDDARPDTDAFYTHQTRKVVNELYKLDFKIFNYIPIL